jgi:hypothetical protein
MLRFFVLEFVPYFNENVVMLNCLLYDTLINFMFYAQENDFDLRQKGSEIMMFLLPKKY